MIEISSLQGQANVGDMHKIVISSCEREFTGTQRKKMSFALGHSLELRACEGYKIYSTVLSIQRFHLSFLQRIYARTVFYPTLAWNYALGRIVGVRNWWDKIDDHVIVGAFPFAKDVQAMHGAGVRAVVNTCEEYAGPQSQYETLGIEQLRIPTTDFTHPQLSDVISAVEFTQKHAELGQVVYIHCKAGRARSATVAICWLIKYREMSAEEAQRHLLSCRPHINPHLTRRPVVEEFERLCQL